MDDKATLTWIHDRMINVYGESANVDFLHRLRGIIVNTPEGRTTININDLKDVSPEQEDDMRNTITSKIEGLQKEISSIVSLCAHVSKDGDSRDAKQMADVQSCLQTANAKLIVAKKFNELSIEKYTQ